MSYDYSLPYNSPPAYVIIGHGKERQVNGPEDLKYNEDLSFIVESGEIADHDVIEIVRGLSSDLNAYIDFSKEDGEYIDIDVSYDPEVELGGLYLMYRGKIEDIWTLENGPETVSTLVEHVVENHNDIMKTFLKANHFPKKYPKPDIRIWCLTCRAPFHKEDQERRREPVYEYEEDEWNNDEGAIFNIERGRWVNGYGNEAYEPYQLNQLKLPTNNYGDNGYDYGNQNGNGQNNYGYGQKDNDGGTRFLWGGSRKSKKKEKTKTKKRI